MRGIPPPGSLDGERVNAGKILAQGEARRSMTVEQLAADLTTAEAMALVALYEALKRCRGRLAMRLLAAELFKLPGWCDINVNSKATSDRGKAVVAELAKQRGIRLEGK